MSAEHPAASRLRGPFFGYFPETPQPKRKRIYPYWFLSGRLSWPKK